VFRHSPVPRQPPPRRAGRHPAARAGLALTLTFIAVMCVLHLRSLRRQLRRACTTPVTTSSPACPTATPAVTQLVTQPVGMIGLLDLDGFKDVNDWYGHDVGDALLIALAHRLSAAIGTRGTVDRLAGDEFLILWAQRPAEPCSGGHAPPEAGPCAR
jgi:GGDEF domain-containing protein